MALLRLQNVYRLKTEEIGNGKIYDVEVEWKMNACDCYTIGRFAYDIDDHFHSIMWMEEALRRVKEEKLSGNPPNCDIQSIIEHLAFSLWKQGNVKHALMRTEELIEMDPNHPRAVDNKEWYEEELEMERIPSNEWRENPGPIINNRSSSLPHNEDYEALCRNEQMNAVDASILYCYYKRDRPFLRIAPIKVEILSLDPLIVIFRHVISDNEISVLQRLASPKLHRASVQNLHTGKTEVVNYRVAKRQLAGVCIYSTPRVTKLDPAGDMLNNWQTINWEKCGSGSRDIASIEHTVWNFDNHNSSAFVTEMESSVIVSIRNRLKLMTNLDMSNAEALQLSTPVYGGATVFIKAKVGVVPTKNDALFWYNLYRDGEGIDRTLHAACPVLIGEKWVANQWFHEYGNEWERPCGLREDEKMERFIGDIGGSEPLYSPNICD